MGSPLDRRFDALFKVLQARIEDLEVIIEKKHIRDQINWRFYFIIILIAWISAILIAMTGLWHQEVRRKAVAHGAAKGQ